MFDESRRVSGAGEQPAAQAGLVNFGDLPGTELANGIVRRVVAGMNATIFEIRIASGAGLPAHAHPCEQFTFVLRGAVRFRVGPDLAEVFTVYPGELFCISGDLLHEITAFQETVVLEMFAPARSDLKNRLIRAPGTSYFRS
jgi:quercetin dioxygenase-like cupin family protein